MRELQMWPGILIIVRQSIFLLASYHSHLKAQKQNQRLKTTYYGLFNNDTNPYHCLWKTINIPCQISIPYVRAWIDTVMNTNLKFFIILNMFIFFPYNPLRTRFTSIYVHGYFLHTESCIRIQTQPLIRYLHISMTAMDKMNIYLQEYWQVLGNVRKYSTFWCIW